MSSEEQNYPQIKSHYPPVIKNSGATAAENYLAELCEKTFLSMWSYPGVFRDQGQPKVGGDGKEICDLLVVFGEHIIIFSDKLCAFQVEKDLQVAWQRWFKRAIAKSAEQAWGAKRWIEQQPLRIFLDKGCKQRLPIPLPDPAKAKYHLVVVAHGISQHVARHFGGSGSLLIDSDTIGIANHTEPFSIGDLDPAKPFVHVFDDHSLRTVMMTRDTISDFVAYLEKREVVLRGYPKIIAPGEEELLPFYLKNANQQGEHDFVFPVPADSRCIALPEGTWADFQLHPRRIEQLRHDRISYVWDSIIERFNRFALRGEQHLVTGGGIADAERILRFMARAPRYVRRALAESIKHMLETAPKHQRMLRVIPPTSADEPFYVFLLFPRTPFEGASYEEYRKVRFGFLESCCWVVKLMNPEAKDIVGFATETAVDADDRSEDACYFDARHWTDEMAEQAREAQAQLRILTNHVETRMSFDEYPAAPLPNRKIGRNEPCPCGSGKKYKKCCINKR